MRSRYCRVCKSFHDIEQDWPAECAGHFSIKEARPVSGIIRDLSPYRSMITGQMIDGRRQHRDHLRAYGCVEVGNDTSHMKARKPQAKASRKELMHRQLADVSDRQAQKMVKQAIKEING